MIFCLFFHSSIVVILLALYSRWLDEETLADLCLYSLVVELLFAIFNVSYIFYTDSIFFLHCGYILVDNFYVNISVIFCFDELSGFFFGILDFALILCFYFLIEYFEYDSNSSGIILLSAMFSHFAMWYFCVFDLFLLVVFWESISLISFLLIQHWSYRLPTYKAGIKVFFISQLGDVPLFVFVFLFVNRFGTTDLSEILSQLFLLSFEYILFANLGIVVNFVSLSAFCLSFALLLKSAQFFFYPWLLDAMEAPVPISAQLHSSTLVIIGFYFYLRFQNLFILAPAVSNLLLIFGISTVVGASILGFFQEDGKKLLACSTASQLGYAVTGLSLFYFEESLILMAFCCCNKAFTFI
jgi:NADH-quinone oxidoreductase subunit L